MPITGAKTELIETDRLILRPIDARDAAAVTDLAGDWEVARYTASIPHPFTRADAEEWISKVVRMRADGSAFTIAITDRVDGRFLGAIGLHPSTDGREAVIGFWLGRPFWRRGYMTEALPAVLRLAFETLALDRVLAAAVPGNTASIDLQEKVGMVYIRHEVEPAPARGGDWEVEVRAITREGWKDG